MTAIGADIAFRKFVGKRVEERVGGAASVAHGENVRVVSDRLGLHYEHGQLD